MQQLIGLKKDEARNVGSRALNLKQGMLVPGL
jgi:hypothetical protein